MNFSDPSFTCNIAPLLNQLTPCHILSPAQATDNAKVWLKTLKQYQLGQIFFAVKACKSISLLKTFSKCGIGADVSSIEEYTHAVRCGINQTQIVFTGPYKTFEEIGLCIRNHSILMVDSIEELSDILAFPRVHSKEGTLCLRLRPQSQSNSRFGMSREDILRAGRLISPKLKLSIGIGFHLNGYLIEDRFNALTECFQIIDNMDQPKIKFIDMGGGIPLYYGPHLASTENTWQKKKFKNFYPYHSDPSENLFVKTLLDMTYQESSIDANLSQRKLVLHLQPGRALLGHCGISAFHVIGVKNYGPNTDIAVLNGMSFSISETWFNSDFLPEPMIIHGQSKMNDAHGKYQTVLAGCSCLEQDILRWHYIKTAQRIQKNDIVIFPNTAGYQMDSNESPFHMKKLPDKYQLISNSDSHGEICHESY